MSIPNVIPKSLIGTELCLMDKQQTEVLFNLFLSRNSPEGRAQASVLADVSKASKLGVLTEILFTRLEMSIPKVAITLDLLAWCSLLSGGNPGRAVMWAWTLREIHLRLLASDESRTEPVSLEDWSEFFSGGVPSAEGYLSVWDVQKVKRGSLLDLKETWESALPEMSGTVTGRFSCSVPYMSDAPKSGK